MYFTNDESPILRYVEVSNPKMPLGFEFIGIAPYGIKEKTFAEADFELQPFEDDIMSCKDLVFI